MSKVTPSNPPLFEHECCGRCGGSGQYSYNQMDGTRCYGCGGSGWKLTKRGHAAQKYLDALRSVRADALAVGDLVSISPYGFCRVTAVRVAPAKELGCYGVGREDVVMVRIDTTKVSTQVMPDAMVKKGWDAETKQQQVAEALAYQATLTQAGVPSKRAAKAEG